MSSDVQTQTTDVSSLLVRAKILRENKNTSGLTGKDLRGTCTDPNLNVRRSRLYGRLQGKKSAQTDRNEFGLTQPTTTETKQCDVLQTVRPSTA